jgi:hypothetical protein
MKKIPAWATHHVEMIDGGEFFVEMSDGVITQFEGVRGSDGLIPHSEYKASVSALIDCKIQIDDEQPRLGGINMTNKTVRPIMTVEARDALDKFHASTGFESRSESIVAIGMLNKDRHMLQDEIQRMAMNHRRVYELNSEKLSNKKREAMEYKILSGLMTAACIALVATMMITGV